MKQLCLSFLCFFFALIVLGQSSEDIVIIPQPVMLEKKPGKFSITSQTQVIAADKNAEEKRVARFFADQLKKTTGFALSSAASGPSQVIFQLNKKEDGQLGTEGYTIDVSASRITVQANKPAGLFYAVQTLYQLLPKEVEGKMVAQKVNWSIPAVHITDYPRFGWRGLMFDVVRHFFTKQQVKDYIDEMVKYKFNLLHLHLTDDEGWRVEIKSLPRLTEFGAWRADKTGTFGNFSPPTADEPTTYGGFYTQDDIKDLVKYASDRFVNILPEVDVPGHSLAAVASYPDLSCTTGTYRVRSGERIMNWSDTGFSALTDNTLCPANEKVYTFLDKVFTELAQLFPFEYIHMGGDECAKNFWEKSDQVKQLMQKEGLKDMHEVQSYFVKKVEKIVESKGKKLIGWDEILEGGLAPNAAVMSWRGIKGGIAAAKLGHEVVMSPTTFVYLDYMQADAAIEPPVYATLRLKTTYSWEPVPDSVDAKFIKGGQANLWTEQVYNMRHAEYMTWPRSLAVAEVLWTPKEKKDWNDFVDRVEKELPRFDEGEVKYAPSMYDPIVDVSKDGNDQLKLDLSTEIEGLDIYYSFDNSFPDRFYPKYQKQVSVPKDAANLRLVTYRGKEKMGRDIIVPISELRRRADRKKR